MPPAQGRGRTWLLAGLAGVAHGLAFPPLGWWPLAFVALAPLVHVARATTARRAGALGALAGLVATSIAGTPALTVAGLHYFGFGIAGAVAFGTTMGVVYHALPTALFAAMQPRLARLPSVAARVGATAAAWAAVEFVRAHPPAGSAWDLLAHTLYAHPLCIQLADLGGPIVVSAVLAGTAAAVAELPRRPGPALATGTALLVLLLGYGAWRLHGETDGPPTIRLALVQGNVPPEWRADPQRASDTLRSLVEATRPVLAARPDLVVWPENALGVLLDANPQTMDAVRELLGPDGPPLLLGAPRAATTTPGRARFFNSAHLLSGRGERLAVYDKRRLVPFAEFQPLARVPLLGWRLDRSTDFSPGGSPTIFHDPAAFGVLVCFETIYPDLARDLVRAGAQLLVSLSNDAWFGRSGGAEQHFAMSVFRAVETRRALARVTDTGVTAVVGPSGRILTRYPEHVRDAWIADVPLRSGRTPYGDVGDAAGYLAILATAAALLRAGGRPPSG